MIARKSVPIFLLCTLLIAFTSAIKEKNTSTLNIPCGDTLVSVSASINKKGIPVLLAQLQHKNKTIDSSFWNLNYPCFKLQQGDINNDGTDDILAGITNKTRFDSVSRKRIHIFKIFEGYIRPLWLGSRVSQPLEDFTFVKRKNKENLIRTIEQEKNGKFLVAEYKWKGFGLEFTQYTKRNIQLSEAKKLLTTIYE